MRVPKTYHYNTDSNYTNIKLDKPIIIPRLPVYANDKQKEKLIKSIERDIRTSMEYKDLIKYLRVHCDMDQCAIFKNFNTDGKKGMIQIHHEPYDLYTITEIVMTKQEHELGYVDELLVAEEVMGLHYEGLVGLIPLSITVHELVHDGKIPIPLDAVYGKFVEFTKRYYDYIDPLYISMLNDKIEMTKKLTADDLSILAVRYVYTNVDGCELPDALETEEEMASRERRESVQTIIDSNQDIDVEAC